MLCITTYFTHVYRVFTVPKQYGIPNFGYKVIVIKLRNLFILFFIMVSLKMTYLKTLEACVTSLRLAYQLRAQNGRYVDSTR